MTALPEGYLDQLVTTLIDDNTVAIILTGSHARGDATIYSDVDIVQYVKQLPPANEQYRLEVIDGFVVSLSTATIAGKREEITHPLGIGEAIEGIRQARMLYDADGAFGAFQAEARAFAPDSAFQAEANRQASRLLVGYCEEAGKILTGLVRDDTSTILLGIIGLILGIDRIIAVQKGVLLNSDNEHFQAIHDAIADDAAWARLWRAVVGYDGFPAGVTVRMRGLSALQLYHTTIDRMQSIIQPEHKAVINHTAAAISTYLANNHEAEELHG